ncbi:MAG: glycogen synthase GlgA [Acidobacteria bacterium]|nr:glycogen synthase GlgA [Acidobacteriota bacterium]MBV9475765.1 glycogen synthase GlgA [Acidobacteriota bacterium]
MRVVFATSEVSPIAKTGGLGDVCGSLPKVLRKMGHEVAVFMPYYRQARQWFDRNGIVPHQLLPTVVISWANWIAEATFLRATLPGSDVPLILVANDYFFEREQIYARAPDGNDDFLLRYTFFCRAVIRACELLDVAPDILHCHDWHTALLPLYLDSGLRGSPQFARTRSVYTIHNLHYQGAAGADAFELTGLHSRYWAPDALEHFGQLNPMKGAILFADEVTTVSPNYAREIQTREHGAGLDGVLRAVSHKVNGILNGIDVDEWNPATDPLLPAHYDADSLRDKTKAKRALSKEAGFRFSAKRPIVGAVSRLVDQKGFQLLIPVMRRLLHAGARLAILGSGEPELENALVQIASEHPDDCRVWIGFDNALAHRIYGGADMLLMPSMYEPCGLNQMYALRYGTLPVVRLTGGLADTVIPFDGTNGEVANGFGFVAAHPFDLYLATWVAMLNFKDGSVWKTLQANGMACDFSWERSAATYDAVYRRALQS